MNPNIWGPPTWIFLHTVTFAYPENPTIDDKKNMYNFFKNLSPILPCDRCKVNFDKHLQKYPLNNETLCSRASLSRWLVDIHNEVNILTGKPTMTYKEAEDYYNRLYMRRYDCINITIYISVITLLIIFFVYIIYLACRQSS